MAAIQPDSGEGVLLRSSPGSMTRNRSKRPIPFGRFAPVALSRAHACSYCAGSGRNSMQHPRRDLGDGRTRGESEPFRRVAPPDWAAGQEDRSMVLTPVGDERKGSTRHGNSFETEVLLACRREFVSRVCRSNRRSFATFRMTNLRQSVRFSPRQATSLPLVVLCRERGLFCPDPSWRRRWRKWPE